MQVNSYFDDQVLSLSFDNSNGKSSIGLMSPGLYEFSTSDDERMVVISGALVVQRQSDPEPVLYSDGEEFLYREIKALALRLLNRPPISASTVDKPLFHSLMDFKNN